MPQAAAVADAVAAGGAFKRSGSSKPGRSSPALEGSLCARVGGSERVASSTIANMSAVTATAPRASQGRL
jgi:hypothetical protein